MLSNIVTMVGGLSENFLNCLSGFFFQIVLFVERGIEPVKNILILYIVGTNGE
jgi:hypothetical protein